MTLFSDKMKTLSKNSRSVQQSKQKSQEAIEERENSEDEDAITSRNSTDDGEISDNSMEYESDADDGLSDGEAVNKSKTNCNPGWADAMQKILNTKKPKRKKTIVFSKAKKLSDVQKREWKEDKVPFEIEGEKEEESEEDIRKAEAASIHETGVKRSRIDSNLKIRVKPSIHDREREKVLQKIATKGVVQLFNAVKQQQAVIDKELSQAGPLERKREQVLKNIDKRAFLDVLMGGSKSIPVNDEKSAEENGAKKEESDKVWKVLRDDFVMGGQLKNWDKKGEDDEDSSAPEELDSDD